MKLTAIIFFSFIIQASGTGVFQNQDIVKDSLVIKKSNTKKQIVIHADQLIKVWKSDNTTEVGLFKELKGDTLILMESGVGKHILVKNIEKIKVHYNKPVRRIVGGAFTLLGASGMGFGGISLVVGTAGLLSGELGVIMLLATPVLFGAGYGVYKLGELLRGKKFNLKNKWYIVVANYDILQH